MAFKLDHSLASRAAVSVVVSLWYHEDIDSLKTKGYVGNCRRWKQCPFDLSRCRVHSAMRTHRLALHKKVAKGVSKLFIPESLKRYLLEFVQIIGENLEDWIETHYSPPEEITEEFGEECFAERFFNLHVLILDRANGHGSKSKVNAAIDVDLRKVLRWDPDGEIDLEQTGEALVRNENDPIKRFRLAFAYCKEDEMLQLWPSVQAHFSSPEAWDSCRAHEVSAVFWWRYFYAFWPESISTYVFHLASVTIEGSSLIDNELDYLHHWHYTNRCTPLALYLVNKLVESNVEIKQVFYSFEIPHKYYGPILFRIPERYRDQLLREYPREVFKQLLLWRLQNLFMDTVERSWDMFDESLFDSILFHIVHGIEQYEDSDIYKRIFLRYWTDSPARLRDVERVFYDRNLIHGRTLRYFVGLLFGHSPAAEDRMKTILFEGRHVLHLARRVRVWEVLSDLVRTCLPPEEWTVKLRLLDKDFPSIPACRRGSWCGVQACVTWCLCFGIEILLRVSGVLE